MGKTAVIYKSKYGSTKKYAQWLSEALSGDLFDCGSVEIGKLRDYDTIVCGGGTYAGSINGIGAYKKICGAFKGKQLILFTCGLADPADPVKMQQSKDAVKKALTPEVFETVSVFHLRGGMEYAKLNFLHRFMMNIVKNMMAKKDPAAMTDAQRDSLQSYGKDVDYTDKAAIAPIVAFACGK